MNEQKLSQAMYGFCDIGRKLFMVGMKGLLETNKEVFDEVAEDIKSGRYRAAITVEISPPCVVGSMFDETGESIEIFRYTETLNTTH